MYFFNKDEFEIAQNACKNAIKNHVVVECKHTDLDIVTITNSGVCCFYCNGYNKQEMKWVIKFMLENDLIRKTKSGRLYNISFKFDTQTHMGQYGEDFHAQIKLSDFVDLNTGAFL